MERITGGGGKGRDQGSAGYENLNTKNVLSVDGEEFKKKENDPKFLSKRNNSSTNLNKINNNNNTNYSNDMNNEINRNKNKDRKKSYQNNRSVDCIVVAPEGTRSLSGQLLAFKKGPFYLWLQMGGGGKCDNER